MTLSVGHRPTDKGQYEWGDFFPRGWQETDQAAVSSSHAQRLKKKKQKLCHPAGRTWHVTDLHTFCQVLCSQTCSSSPCCWGCIFSFLHLVCWDGTEKGYCSVMPAPQRADDSDGVSSYPWLRCLWVSIWDTVRLHPAEQGNTLQLASDLENVHNALLSENSSI